MIFSDRFTLSGTSPCTNEILDERISTFDLPRRERFLVVRRSLRNDRTAPHVPVDDGNSTFERGSPIVVLTATVSVRLVLVDYSAVFTIFGPRFRKVNVYTCRGLSSVDRSRDSEHHVAGREAELKRDPTISLRRDFLLSSFFFPPWFSLVDFSKFREGAKNFVANVDFREKSSSWEQHLRVLSQRLLDIQRRLEFFAILNAPAMIASR